MSFLGQRKVLDLGKEKLTVKLQRNNVSLYPFDMKGQVWESNVGLVPKMFIKLLRRMVLEF